LECKNGKITTYERGAWGQGLAITHNDPALHQMAQQRKQLEEQNAKLQCQINLFKTEIEAIQKLNIVPRAL
jgi:ribosomal protein L9